MSALALAFFAAASTQAPAPPTFAVGVESVYVDVFVTEANHPVTGLTEADFELPGGPCSAACARATRRPS